MNTDPDVLNILSIAKRERSLGNLPVADVLEGASHTIQRLQAEVKELSRPLMFFCYRGSPSLEDPPLFLKDLPDDFLWFGELDTETKSSTWPVKYGVAREMGIRWVVIHENTPLLFLTKEEADAAQAEITNRHPSHLRKERDPTAMDTLLYREKNK